jgi:RHS repeat-associated protein
MTRCIALTISVPLFLLVAGVQTAFAYDGTMDFVDVDGVASASNDSDIDVTAVGQSSENPADARYFIHQDRNWNVVALTAYVPRGGLGNIDVVERYSYGPYGSFTVHPGLSAGGAKLARPRPISSVGSLAHQGLPSDTGKRSYQNRHREYVSGLQRFGQRDPIAYSDSLNAYEVNRSQITSKSDWSGLCSTPNCGFIFAGLWYIYEVNGQWFGTRINPTPAPNAIPWPIIRPGPAPDPNPAPQPKPQPGGGGVGPPVPFPPPDGGCKYVGPNGNVVIGTSHTLCLSDPITPEELGLLQREAEANASGHFYCVPMTCSGTCEKHVRPRQVTLLLYQWMGRCPPGKRAYSFGGDFQAWCTCNPLGSPPIS